MTAEKPRTGPIVRLTKTPSAEELVSLMRQNGVIVVKNAFADLSDAKSYTERHARILRTVDVVGTRYLGFHGEMNYTPFPPDLLCFLCMSPPNGLGGQTTLCDGIELASRLSPSATAFFEAKQIVMVSEWSSKFLCDRLRLPDENDVAAYLRALPGTSAERISPERWKLTFVRSAFSRTRFQGAKAFVNSVLLYFHDRRDHPDWERSYSLGFDDGADLPDAILEELGELSEALTYDYDWDPADYVIVDNSRMLHGRRACASGDASDRKLVNFHCNWLGPAI